MAISFVIENHIHFISLIFWLLSFHFVLSLYRLSARRRRRWVVLLFFSNEIYVPSFDSSLREKKRSKKKETYTYTRTPQSISQGQHKFTRSV